LTFILAYEYCGRSVEEKSGSLVVANSHSSFGPFTEGSTSQYSFLRVEEDPHRISKPSVATHEIKFDELLFNALL
jgi:hypothetical protein